MPRLLYRTFDSGSMAASASIYPHDSKIEPERPYCSHVWEIIRKRKKEVCFCLNWDDTPKKKNPLAQDTTQLAGIDTHHSFF